MPTIQEIIAKRKELWPTATTVDAKNAITPVSPITQSNQDQLAANRARVQSQIASGERPEVGTSVTPQAEQTQAPTPPPAPVTPSTTPSGATMNADWTVTPATPVTPTTPATPTTPTTPVTETPAPTTPVTPTAVTPIVDKNAEIKAKNEAKLAENQQKAKLAEEQRQKWITEQNTALANNEWAILNTLKTGWVIPESVKTSPFYKSAQQTYNKLQQYSTYSTNELVTAMNQGSIVPWTNVYNEMMKDPAMKQKLTDAQVYRAWNPVNSTQIYENASSEIMSNNPTTANYLADGVITQEEYDQATNNTQVVAKAKEVEEKANKYNTLKAEYDSIEDEVNKQFPWSPFADSIIADRQKAKYKNLVLAKWEWETSTGTLTELKSQASTLFETNLKLAETRRAEQNTIAAEKRKIQAEKDMLQYKTDFEKKQAEAALKDPTTQIKATLEEFSKLGVTATGWLPWKVQEAKDWIAKWGTLDWYVNQMRKDLMAKPEYIAQALKKANEWVSFQTIGDKVYKVKDGQLIDTGISATKAEKGTFVKWEDGNWINTTTKEIINEKDLISQQTTDKLNTYLSNTPVWAKWGQCGVYANKNPVAVANWFHFGDSYQSKLDQTNSKEGAIGAFAVWNPGGVTKDNGHVWQIVWESQDGNSWIIRDSNFSNNPKDETVREHAVPKSVISSTGGAYAVPWLWKTTTNGNISDSDIAMFNSAKYNPQTDKDKARAKRYEDFQNKSAEIFSDPNANIVDKMKYSKWSKDLAESPNKSYKDMGLVVSQLDRLSKSIKDYDSQSWFWSGMNPIQWLIANKNPWDTKAQEIKTQLTQLVPKVARWVFWEVGVLTDQDIANYIQTLPNIKQTADVQDVVQLALLATVRDSLNNSLSVDSATYDTSGLVGNYKKLDAKIQELQNRVSWTKTNTPNKDDFMNSLKSIANSFQNSISGVKK